MDPIAGCNLYLLKLELRIFTHIVMDDCNSDRLRPENWLRWWELFIVLKSNFCLHV